MRFTKPGKKFVTEFLKLANKAKTICITAHLSPDEDSVAAMLAVYHFLTVKYPKKKIKIIQTGEKVDKYNIFANFDKVQFVRDLIDHLAGVDLLIMLDGCEFSRFTYQAEKLKSFKIKTICIDHHSSQPDNFNLSLIIPNYSSCIEIIYLSFFKKQKINKALAEIFMLGILGDTGCFKYLKPDQLKTLEIAKKLIKIADIEIQEFLARYETIPKKVFKIVSELIKNTKYHQIKNWPDFQVSFIERGFAKENNLGNNEVSEASHIYMSHYLRLVKGYPWGFVLTPKVNGDYSISFRSLPQSVNVRNLMERMRLGGGHNRAAGGGFKMKNNKPRQVPECLKKILNWMKHHKPVLE